MQKSKLFFHLEKKKGMHINMAGLIYTEEESVNGWINRCAKDRKPKTYAELETWDNGHTYECFHNLDIEVINAEIRTLQSVHMFSTKKLKSRPKCCQSFKILPLQKITSF